MSDVTSVDANMCHLLPAFRAKVISVLAEATRECAGKYEGFVKWSVFEGFRSQARQTHLYNQGRTTPGDIVTNARVSLYHNKCIAVDVVWVGESGNPHWDGEAGLWAQFGHCAKAAGLEWGGSWSGSGAALGDVGHIQIPKAEVPVLQNAIDAFKQTEGLV